MAAFFDCKFECRLEIPDEKKRKLEKIIWFVKIWHINEVVFLDQFFLNSSTMDAFVFREKTGGKGELGVLKRVAAGAHLPTP